MAEDGESCFDKSESGPDASKREEEGSRESMSARQRTAGRPPQPGGAIWWGWGRASGQRRTQVVDEGGMGL